MRISDWSSDVCSSDLEQGGAAIRAERRHRLSGPHEEEGEGRGEVLLLRNLLIGAARRIASNPEVHARAAETYQTEVKPRLQAAGAAPRDLTRQRDPLRDPPDFARRPAPRVRDVHRPHLAGPGLPDLSPSSARGAL